MKKEQSEVDDTLPVDEIDTIDTPAEAPHEMKVRRASKPHLFFGSKKRTILTIVGLVVIALGILFAVPTTRYAMLGTVLKKDVKVMVTDSVTNKPVTQAMVTLDGQTVKTSSTGEADVPSVPVGEYTVSVTKKYYKNSSITLAVPITSHPQTPTIALVATGRQVQVKVTNTLTTAALEKAVVTVGDTAASTDINGLATIVLPADKPTLDGTVTLNGYNTTRVNVKVTEQADQNNFTLTPTGSVYYVSNQTGVADIMKANLDSTSPAVVIKGTGYEKGTTLVASDDWRYLAFYATRVSSASAQLYVVDTQKGTINQIDAASGLQLSLLGWSGHHFVYVANNYSGNAWDAGRQKIMSYDADAGQLVTVDQTTVVNSQNGNYLAENFTYPALVNDKIVYGQSWTPNGLYIFQTTGNKAAIVAANADGTNKQKLQEFPMHFRSQIDERSTGLQTANFRVTIDNGPLTYFSYGTSLVNVGMTDDQFYGQNQQYYTSPDGMHTAWTEVRDGKGAILVGDANGKNGQVVALQANVSVLRWFDDKYILLTKQGSEMDIISAVTTSSSNPITKITNYSGGPLIF